MPRQYNYAIGAGYGLALSSLAYLEEIIPTGDTDTIVAPQGLGLFRYGNALVRGDGTNAYNGYPAQDWLLAGLTRNGYQYIRTTFCGGGYSGKVTINTRAGATAYARYNAILWLDQ